MDQLITKLEARINWLVQQLESANEEINSLKGKQNESIEQNASMDLLQHMTSRSSESQTERHTKDSINLFANLPVKNEALDTKEATQQLNFDLLHEHADNSGTTTTKKEQIDHMTSQQTELSDLQENTLETQDSGAVEVAEKIIEATTLTAEQKKRQKNQKNNRRLIKMLEDRYPKAFDWNQPKPLKVGIDKDMILDEDFNASKQKRALAAYTRSDRYKKCLLSGQPRIDLEGVAINDEPALPASMIPAKPSTLKTRTTSRPAKDKVAQSIKNKPKAKPQRNPKTQSKPRQDEAYVNLSPEDRMKAKLEKLLNKS